MTLPDLKTSGIAFKNKELELNVIDFERYHPSAGHVMLDVKHSGVCRTDIDYAHGALYFHVIT
jgi:D-arabinose 1-dehydrogenase-like Zn-dependent alcohol dehydrogenase